MDYPANNGKSKDEAPVKKIERVTTADPIVKKKTLGKKFTGTFFNGDGKSAAHYVVFSVLVPAAKDALADAGSQGLERLIFGEAKSRSRRPSAGAPGHVSYNRMSRPAEHRRELSRQARAQHDFDEIILANRGEAERVIDQLFDLVSKYETASVADLYELIGLESSHTDHKWGWTNMRGADITRVRNGYLLDLPEAEALR